MTKQKLTLVKAGGKVLDTDAELSKLLNGFATINHRKVLVHGGGVFINELCDKLGIDTQMVNGRRITSKPNMDVVLMACAGKLNKELVAGLNKLGMEAIGLCGGDVNLIKSHKRPPVPIDFGWVGDIDAVDTKWLNLFIENGAVPVISSISQSNEYELLNTNADTIAAHVAIALSGLYEVELFFYFDKPGVLADSTNNNSVIENLSISHFEEMKANQAIHTGMLPKLQNGYLALKNGVSSVKLGSVMGQGTTLTL